MWDELSQAASSAWDSAASAASSAWDSAASGTSSAWDSAASATSSAWDAASSGAASAWDTTAEAAAQTWTVVTDAAATEALAAWGSVRDGWSAEWKALQAAGSQVLQAAIDADPTGTAQTIEAFLTELAGSRQDLDALRAKLPDPPVTPEDEAAWARYHALEARYQDLAAGFYADALPVETTAVGFIPLLVVAGIAAGTAACAWAVAAYQYAVNLREQTALADRELSERVAASREGRTLQATTLPEQPDPIADATGGMGKLLLGGLALGAVALALPLFLKRS